MSKSAKLILPKLSPGEIRSTALNILNYEMNIEAWKQNNVAIRGRKFIGKKGVGDILGFHRVSGKICMCEVKALGDVFSQDQKDLLTKVHKSTGIALQATQEGLRVIVKPFVNE